MVCSDDDMGMPCGRTRSRWLARLYKTALRARILVHIESEKENVDLEKPGSQVEASPETSVEDGP